MPKLLLSISSISPQDFFISKGLYEPFQCSENDIDHLINLLYSRGPVDCYCVGCGKSSVFTPKPTSSSIQLDGNREIVSRGLIDRIAHQKEFTCTRDRDHVLTFGMVLEKGILTKIGQYPSYADIHLQDVEKYKSLLPNDLYIELKKAIRLFANGIGAGSLVYLRRIIEKFMIEPAHQKAKAEQTGWDEEAYDKSRMREKIKLLVNYLPKYLVDNSIIYGIVSKGIHELSEKECVDAFPVLKSFIEFVLTDMKNERDAEVARKQLATDLDRLAGKSK